jgi:hypothetical protein
MQFFDFLNSLHPNLQFTYEIGPDSIAFLDTKISIENDGFSSTIFRKATNTNVLLNFSALCPFQWKLGLISCLLNRAFVVCSSWSIFHSEIENLRSIFTNNGYPKRVFDNCVSSFFSKKFERNQTELVKETSTIPFVIQLPYVGHPSLNFKKQLTNLYRKFGTEVRIVFKSFKVGDYFSLKSKTPFDLKARVVYRFYCTCDRTMSYIGKTRRHLAIRSKEHFTRQSAIFDHIKNCQTCSQSSTIDNFEIIDTGKFDFDLYIKEALHIKYNKPKLNTQLVHQGAAFRLNLF